MYHVRQDVSLFYADPEHQVQSQLVEAREATFHLVEASFHSWWVMLYVSHVIHHVSHVTCHVQVPLLSPQECEAQPGSSLPHRDQVSIV